MKKDPRVDVYIENAAPFAKPILKKFRKMVQKLCPEVEETIKWGFPNFEYKGPLCSMAAFKEHAAFTFWKASLMKQQHDLKVNNKQSMGHLGKIKSLADLPDDNYLEDCLREAVSLNANDIKKPPRKKPLIAKEIIVPEELKLALEKSKKAKDVFENFSPSHRKEYVEWITEAKTDVTRDKRIKAAIEMLSEGKSRNWKYQSK